jgi:hypothetical protein
MSEEPDIYEKFRNRYSEYLYRIWHTADASRITELENTIAAAEAGLLEILQTSKDQYTKLVVKSTIERMKAGKGMSAFLRDNYESIVKAMERL